MKSKGQIAYEEDVRRYKAAGGPMVRTPWGELPQYCKESWERNPTPREW